MYIYPWFFQLNDFEARWSPPRIAETLADDSMLATDKSGNIPIVHALEQEHMPYLQARVKTCGGAANAVIRRLDGKVMLLPIRDLRTLDQYPTITSMFDNPPEPPTILGEDEP